jgi:flagellin-like hook-associated protein FlgL
MPSIRRTSFLGSNMAAQARLREAQGRLSTASAQVATSRAYDRPSQNVSASSRAALLQDQVDRIGVYDRAINDATSRLSYADDMLGQAMNLYHRVTELGTLAGSPLANASVKTSIRQEVIDIRRAIEGIANSRYLGEPVFAGFSGADAVEFDSGASAWSFTGDSNDRVERRIGQTESIRVNVTAAEAFRSGGNDIFSMLDELAASLTADDNAATVTAMDKLAGLRSTLSAAQAQVGATTQMVEKAGQRNSSLVIRLQEEITNVRDVDLAMAITDRSRLQIAYEAAIAVTAKGQNMSIMDWLR